MSERMLRVSGIVEESIVDGPGYRFTVFTQGCLHGCPGCHNPQTHPLDGGTEVSADALFDRIARNPLLRGVTFSGGEPFQQAAALAPLAARIHAQTRLDVVTYTGYTYEALRDGATAENAWADLLEQTDYLIDGPFLLAEKSLDLKFRGSRNQRILDMRATRAAGEPVLTEL